MVKRITMDTITEVGDVLQVRFRKEELTNGQVTGFLYHRTCVEPGTDAVKLLGNISLALTDTRDPWAAVTESDVLKLEAAVAIRARDRRRR